MPFDRLFGTLGGHIQSRSLALYGSHITAIWYLVWHCIRSRICIHSDHGLECFGSYIALVRHGSGSLDLSSLSGAFAGIFGVRHMLSALFTLIVGCARLLFSGCGC